MTDPGSEGRGEQEVPDGTTCDHCGKPVTDATPGACETHSGAWGCSEQCYYLICETEQRLQLQRCKVCFAADGFDFHVDDETWKLIVPVALRSHVVCLSCFDTFAYRRGCAFVVETITFAGDMFSMEFKRTGLTAGEQMAGRAAPAATPEDPSINQGQPGDEAAGRLGWPNEPTTESPAPAATPERAPETLTITPHPENAPCTPTTSHEWEPCAVSALGEGWQTCKHCGVMRREPAPAVPPVLGDERPDRVDPILDNPIRDQPPGEPGFAQQLAALVNRYSLESASNTPDFILAEYLCKMLIAYEETVQRRAEWYGRMDRPGQSKPPPVAVLGDERETWPGRAAQERQEFDAALARAGVPIQREREAWIEYANHLRRITGLAIFGSAPDGADSMVGASLRAKLGLSERHEDLRAPEPPSA